MSQEVIPTTMAHFCLKTIYVSTTVKMELILIGQMRALH